MAGKAEIILLRPDADHTAVGIVLPILPFSFSSLGEQGALAGR